MVKILKNLFIVITCFITIVFIYGFINYSKPFEKFKINNSLYDEIQILIIDNQKFRDLNKESPSRENKRKEIGGIKRYTCELTLSRHGIPLILWSFFLKDQISILEKRIEIMPTAIKQSH